MDEQVRAQVERLHATPLMAVVAVSGGGFQAIAWLLGVAGASRTVIEAIVPYSEGALWDLLGYSPEKHVSPETARHMARAAYERARKHGPPDRPVVGIGCTAAIRTDRGRRGDHRCYVAAWSERGVTTYGVTLTKGQRERDAEDDIIGWGRPRRRCAVRIIRSAARGPRGAGQGCIWDAGRRGCL